MCEKSGPQLAVDATLLFRQVPPITLEDDGEPSSQAFSPWRDIDDGCLSVDHSGLTTEEKSYLLFTTPRPDGFGQASAGSWGLTIEEMASIGATTWSDPVSATADTPANPAHTLVEYPGDKKAWKKAGRILKLKARARGRLFPRQV